MPEGVVVALRLIGIAALEIGERTVPLGSGKRAQLLAFVGASDIPVKRDDAQTALWAPDVNQTGLKELLRRLQAETERDTGQELPKLLLSRDDDPAIPVGHLALNSAIVCDAAHVRKQAKRARTTEDPAAKRHAWQQVVSAYEAGGGEFGEGLPQLGGTWDTWLARQCDELRREYEAAMAGLESLGGGTIVTNLRQGRGRFFGRDDLKQTVRSWAESGETGVLCLHGPGGVGKTRLSEEACRPLSELFDLIWLVSFEALKPDTATGQQVASEIALKLGAENVDEAAKRLPEFVRSKGERALLILDNFESADNPETQKWLAEFAQTGIRCLVTSRKRLTLRNIGQNVSVECLEVPRSPETDFDTLPAVQLFRDRLDTEVKLPPFAELPEEDRAGLVEVLRVTDGFPLAIEIVAANRVHATGSLKEIAATLGVRRMRYRAELGESGGGEERHESMGSCFQWSLDLLPQEEAKRFVTLGVFPFDFGLEAAQAICGVSADDLTRWWQRSLVQRDTQKPGDRRFLPSLLKEYAWDTCEEGVRKETEERIVRYFVKMVSGFVRDGRLDINDDVVRATLEAEWQTVYALRHTALHTEGINSYLLLNNIESFLRLHGYWSEMEVMLLDTNYIIDEYISNVEIYNDYEVRYLKDTKAAVLMGLGITCSLRGIWVNAANYFEKCLEIKREINDRNGEGNVLMNLGNVYSQQGFLSQADVCFKDSLDIAQSLGDRYVESNILNSIGIVKEQKCEYDHALDYLIKSLAIKRDIGDRHGESKVLMNLGNVSLLCSRWEEAVFYYQNSFELSNNLGDRSGASKAIASIGNVYNKKGEWYSVACFYEDSLEVCRSLDDRHGVCMTLGNLGDMYQQQGKLQKALECHQEAGRLAYELGDAILLGKALTKIGIDQAMRGELAQSRETIQYSVDILAQTEDVQTSEWSRGELARVQGLLENSGG